MKESPVIYRLNETWSEYSVHFHRSADDFTRELHAFRMR